MKECVNIFIISFSILIILSSLGICSKIDRIKMNIDLLEDNRAFFNVTIDYLEEVDMSDFYTLAKIENIKVFKGSEEINCSIEEMPLGTSIVCKNAFSRSITYTFYSINLVESGKRLNIFSYQFPITTLINRIDVIVKIPFGAVIADDASLEYTGLTPFYPENGIKGSDGRRIFVEWSFENPKLGESIKISTIYEKILKEENTSFYIIFISILVVIFLFAIIFLFFIKRRKDVSKVLPILNENERAVMKIILKSKETLDQRKIVKETGFSKAKVSRVLKDLEERGLIKREKVGRATKVKMIFGRDEK